MVQQLNSQKQQMEMMKQQQDIALQTEKAKLDQEQQKINTDANFKQSQNQLGFDSLEAKVQKDDEDQLIKLLELEMKYNEPAEPKERDSKSRTNKSNAEVARK